MIGFVALAAAGTAWLFIFIYKYLYFAIINEMVILNIKSDLVISRVQKNRLEELERTSAAKNNPEIIVNFAGLRNPFRLTPP